jgi:hypothetical protein
MAMVRVATAVPAATCKYFLLSLNLASNQYTFLLLQWQLASQPLACTGPDIHAARAVLPCPLQSVSQALATSPMHKTGTITTLRRAHVSPVRLASTHQVASPPAGHVAHPMAASPPQTVPTSQTSASVSQALGVWAA